MRRLGKEFVDKRGNISYYIKGGKNSITKHRLLYEEHYGVTLGPKDRVIFLNGDNRDFRIENLYLLTAAELGTLNRKFGISKDPEETLTHIAMVKLILKRMEIAKNAGLTDEDGCLPEDKKEWKKRYASKESTKIRHREYQRERRKNPEYKARERMLQQKRRQENREEVNRREREYRREKMKDPAYRAEVNRKAMLAYYRRKAKKEGENDSDKM